MSFLPLHLLVPMIQSPLSKAFHRCLPILSLQSSHIITHLQNQRTHSLPSRRPLSHAIEGFTRPVPKSLNDILKIDKLKDKSTKEISNIWNTYHDAKSNVYGTVLDAHNATQILQRAKECPYFLQPVFRDAGHFQLLSQFFSPCHFYLAYLEAFKNNPSNAQPVISISMFLELESSHDVTLVRCEVIHDSIQDQEGQKLLRHTLDSYLIEREFEYVRKFNHQQGKFDVDEYVKGMNVKWKK